MDRKKDIIKIISRISGRYSEYEVFTDWIDAVLWRSVIQRISFITIRSGGTGNRLIQTP